MDTNTLPDQPDGIADDSFDLPDPARAAERVAEFLREWGDGRVHVDGVRAPLYARDLEALRKAQDRHGPELERLRDRLAEAGQQAPKGTQGTTLHAVLARGIDQALLDFGASLSGCTPSMMTGHVIRELRVAGLHPNYPHTDEEGTER